MAVTPPPPAKRPEPPKPAEPEVEQTMEEGVAVVEEVLQGKVIEDTALANAAVDSEPGMPGAGPCAICGDPSDHDGRPHSEAVGDGKTRADVQPTTPVASEDPEPVQEPARPTEGEVTVACGTPRHPDSTPVAGVGCGEPLTLTIEGGRIVGAQEGQQPGIIDIAALKYGAFLHNACFNKARSAVNA